MLESFCHAFSPATDRPWVSEDDKHPTERRSQNLLNVMFFNRELFLMQQLQTLFTIVSLLNAKGKASYFWESSQRRSERLPTMHCDSFGSDA